MVASGSMKRADATQSADRGPAISPSAPAQLARVRAGVRFSSSTLKAELVDHATTAGSKQPVELTAGASAAIARSDSNAADGPVTAARGTVDVDLGPTRVVSNAGTGRASGGGQPSLNFTTQARHIARRQIGGGPTMAIDAELVADVPASPSGSGGGQPATLETDVNATAAVRMDAGGELPTSGGPMSSDMVAEPAAASSAPTIGAASISRAEVVEAVPGEPVAGGGTGSPMRAATGTTFFTSVTADVVSIAGAPESGGAPSGVPLSAQGVEQGRLSAGLPGPATAQPIGALAGPFAIDSPIVAEASTASIGRRNVSDAAADGPIIGGENQLGAPLRRAGRAGLPSGILAQVDVPPAGPASPVADADAEVLVGGMSAMGMDRQISGGLPVDMAAPEGPGGLGSQLAPDAGTIRRRAVEDSQEIHFRNARFVRSKTGGPLAINLTAALGTDAFSGRKNRDEGDGGGGPGQPPPKTEEAIELGLHFLAGQQHPDGSWSLNKFTPGTPIPEGEQSVLHTDTAATGLTLMVFLGAGYDHKSDKYRDLILAGIEYLLRNQKASGDLYDGRDPESDRSVWLYSHGIATIALCEAYGMTLDPELREPAQKAIDFIVQAQHEDRGGWRYSPNDESDTSVTDWLMMALKSGQLANLDVPDETFTKIEHWLDRAQESKTERHLYAYNPYAPDTEEQRHGRKPNKTMSSVGLLMRLYLGWHRDNPNMLRGADYLLDNLPSNGSLRKPERDTYYWYYATQVMRHMGGEYWERWNERLHPLLIDSQTQDGPLAGSWNPRYPVPDRWAPQAGRIYVTTLNLLSLEVYYRLLPIYDKTLK